MNSFIERQYDNLPLEVLHSEVGATRLLLDAMAGVGDIEDVYGHIRTLRSDPPEDEADRKEAIKLAKGFADVLEKWAKSVGEAAAKVDIPLPPPREVDT